MTDGAVWRTVRVLYYPEKELCMESYRTVMQETCAEFTEKRSKFIGYIKPVQTREQADAFIQEIKTKHWDATHNVYAYVLRRGQIQRYSDDGEPQGTAGIPVLEVLRKAGLTDAAVVVTRYFGGVLLGGGGLVRAYSHAAALAVDSAGVLQMLQCKIARVRCDYTRYGKIAALIAACRGAVDDTVFADAVQIAFHMPLADFGGFVKQLSEMSCGEICAESLGEDFFAVSDF